MKNRKVWAIDTEIYPNFFLICGLNVDTGSRRYFHIFEDDSFMPEFIRWFNTEVKGIVTYNGLGFDGPLIQHVIITEGNTTPETLYKLAEALISREGGYQESVERPHIDMMRMLHLDRFGIGLKAAAFWLRHDTIQDLPIPPGSIITADQIDDLIEYCFNDCDITAKLFHKFKGAITLRKQLLKTFGIDVLNKANAQIGEELMLQLLSKGNAAKKMEIKNRRTFRDIIHIEDCIPDYIKFETPELQRILDKCKTATITPDKKAGIDEKFQFAGMEWVFGAGGLHCFAKPGEYSGNIIASDFSSYYPNLAVRLKIRPEHLGDEFSDLYLQIYEERKKHKKGTPENMAYKLALNGNFGKFASEYSYLYDPLALYRITIAGQLTMAMHIEKLYLCGIETFIVNTDGYSVRLKPGQESLYLTLCNETEALVGIELEHFKVKAMYAADVNNYVEIQENGEVKHKGRYSFNREITQNPSALIVPKAVSKYFVEGVPVEKTIRECKDIFDFCIRATTTKGWHHELGHEPQQKTLRYYVSMNGDKLSKVHEDGRRIGIQASSKVALYNQHFLRPMHEYGIDYAFYIGEASKMIEQITPSQLTLL